MDLSVSCGEHLQVDAHSQSPFSKIIALGFYDGPTSGVLECAKCSAVYRFEMVDWDETQDTRVFSLAPLPPGSLNEIVDACQELGPPQWPVWVPVWQFASDDLREDADLRVQGILDRARAPELLVAWTGYGERILAVRNLTPDDIPDPKGLLASENPDEARDWFAFLGLVN